MNAVRIPILLLSLCAVLSTGCFSVKHRLPPHAYFGTLPAAPGEHASHFERSAMKNWLLAGLVPWSRFSSDDLLAESGAGTFEKLLDRPLGAWPRFGCNRGRRSFAGRRDG